MKQRLINLIVLTLILFFQMTLSAQDSVSFVLLGMVTDAESGHRLSDVQVHVGGSQVSTMTNADGRFSLKLSQRPQWVECSAVGYSNYRLSSEQIASAMGTVAQTSQHEVRIRLQPRATLLRDVFVYSPDNILEAAMDRIETNFPQQAQSYLTFYRETIRKRSNYVSVSEAVMELYKGPYNMNYDRDAVRLLKGRSLMSQKARDTISVHVMGGPTESLYLDLVKHRDDFLCPEMLKHYRLEIETPQVINDRPQYVISFEPIHQLVDQILFRGRVYIDHETLTFTRIEYNMDMSDPVQASAAMVARKPLGMRFRARALEIVMNYHYDGQVSRLQYMRTTYRFDCDWKRRGLATHYEAVSEMLVTDTRSEAVRPERRSQFRQHDLLNAQLRDFADPDFWKDYNILLPSESLEHAFRRIKKTYK